VFVGSNFKSTPIKPIFIIPTGKQQLISLTWFISVTIITVAMVTK